MRKLIVTNAFRKLEEKVVELFGNDIVKDDGSYPCEYSPKNNPHPPIKEGEFECDGYGNMICRERNEVMGKKCKCYREWLDRKWVGAYSRQLTSEVNMNLMAVDTKRGALAEALSKWDFKTPALLLSGAPGVGKTLAGHYIVHQRIKRHHVEGIYMPCEGIADDLRVAGMGDESEKQAVFRKVVGRMDAARNEGSVIFMDDIGRERDSQRAKEEIAGLITKVYERRGFFIATTNMVGKEMVEHYGMHVVDRLCDPHWCQTVRIEGMPSARRHLWDTLG